MSVLETPRLAASSAILGDERASALVTLPHLATKVRRDRPTALGRLSSDCEDSNCAADAACTSDDWPPDWRAFEREVVVLTNRYRAAGARCASDSFDPAPALEMDELIRRAARGHSQDMGRRSYFEHDSLDGRSFADRMRDTGFSGASPRGENIAAGQATPRDVIDGWMASPGHCRNIMNRDYRTIGVGYAFESGSRFGCYWTQDFAASH